MQTSPNVHLSIVVPAYNEATRLTDTLVRIGAFLAAKPFASEIVIVDDGSTDGTSRVVQEISQNLSVPVRAFRYEENRGKGFALKVGFAHAVGRFILFTDADLSTPIAEADRFLERLEAGCDIAVGSRRMQGARIVVHQPWIREKMGMVFTALVRRFFVDVSDSTCGFKGFRAEVGKPLFALLRISDWSFDAELLFLARRGNHRIEEIPVEWQDHADTKVALLRASILSLWGLFRIGANALLGTYRSPMAIGEFREWRSPACAGSSREAEA